MSWSPDASGVVMVLWARAATGIRLAMASIIETNQVGRGPCPVTFCRRPTRHLQIDSRAQNPRLVTPLVLRPEFFGGVRYPDPRNETKPCSLTQDQQTAAFRRTAGANGRSGGRTDAS